MIDLLLITDIPRVRKIFSRLADESTRVRITNNLEKGGEELAAEKPAMVFVQTHLSGLSAEIILMHLKKQLGRKRTRFVLLATGDQVSRETINSYHAHIDISAPDDHVQSRARELMAALLAKPAKKSAVATPDDSAATPQQGNEPDVIPVPEKPSPLVVSTQSTAFELPSPSALPVAAPAQDLALSGESTPVEQGIAYPSRPRLSVYSEFNNSFDSAVETLDPPAKVIETLHQQEHAWQSHESEAVPRPKLNSRRNFLLWLVPVVVVVIVVTFLQQKRTKSPASAITPAASLQEPAKPAPAPRQTATANPAPAVLPTAQEPAVAPLPMPAPANKPSAGMIPASVPAQPAKGAAVAHPSRPTQLPDFIPRYGYDKNYGKENPGWERYKGQVTEFKVLREGEWIKAIQVVDQGGQGVPESFMKGVVRQLAKNPSFQLTATEKKDGYEIQRGRLSETQDVVYYRDADSGRLRGFVVTWR